MTQNKTKQANCLPCRASRPCPSLLLLWLRRLHDLQNREPACPSSALQSEQDLSTQRNAFQMLCNHAQDRAVNYLLAQTDNVAQWGDILQMSVLELIRKVGKAQLKPQPSLKLSCSAQLCLGLDPRQKLCRIVGDGFSMLQPQLGFLSPACHAADCIWRSGRPVRRALC